MKPFKKHYVQCGESLNVQCVIELLFLNKIKRSTTQNNIDNKGRGETKGSDGLGGEGAEGCMICACVQTSTYHNKSMMLQRLLSSVGGGRWALVFGAGFGWCC